MTKKTELTTSFRFWTAVISVFSKGAGKRRLHTKLEVLSAKYTAERDARRALSTELGDIQESTTAVFSDNARLARENQALRNQLDAALGDQQKRFPEQPPTPPPHTPSGNTAPSGETTHSRIPITALYGNPGVTTLAARWSDVPERTDNSD